MGNMSDENCRDIAIRDYRTTTERSATDMTDLSISVQFT